MIESFPAEILALLVGIAFIAGFIDSIAGGGGLLTIPALLLAGLNPAQAIATNKVQAVFGSGSATFAFARAKMIDWKEARTGFFCSAIAAALGAYLISQVNPDFLRSIIPFMLIALALYFAFAPNLSDEPRRHLVSAKQHGLGAGSAIGFYDGIFGPGTGSFFAVSFVTLLGYGIKKATAHTKLFNFASNLGSLAVFLFMGKALIFLGLLMALGQICGATLGARSAIKHGAKLIRPLLVVMCCAMALKLLLT
jgi:uncharacterized membrane protein YfcA